jgi:integrase
MKVQFVRPRKDFSSPEELVELASGNVGDAAMLHLTDVQLLPVIVDSSGLPLAVPNLFLAHIALRSNSTTGDTARTYSESLLRWLRFLEKRNTDQQSVTEELLTVYRNALVNRSTADGQRLHSSATVNLRLAIVEGFYKWGQRSGVMRTPLGEYLRIREKEGGGHVWRSAGTARRSGDSLRLGLMQRLPRVLNPEEISRLFAVTSQPYKLMFRWGVATGMRRFEVCNLRRSTLASAEISLARGKELIPIEIIRKGGKTVTVHAPAALVEETLWYCLTDRPKEASAVYSDFVFFNKKGQPFARGSISRVFRQSADRIGLDATLHHLRHTFATLVLGILEAFERRSGAVNSIKTVQILLGHANVTTTEVYLRALDVASEDVKEALDYLYGATL